MTFFFPRLLFFCNVQVIAVPDVDSVYRVPLVLEEQGLVDMMWKQFSLPPPTVAKPLQKWRWLADRFKFVREKVKIVLVGKYTGLGDAYLSVTKSLQHACIFAGRKLELQVRMSFRWKRGRERLRERMCVFVCVCVCLCVCVCVLFVMCCVCVL